MTKRPRRTRGLTPCAAVCGITLTVIVPVRMSGISGPDSRIGSDGRGSPQVCTVIASGAALVVDRASA
jgi:hypothetical protein